MKYAIIMNYKGKMIESKKYTRKREQAEMMQNVLIDLFDCPVGIIEIWEKGDNTNGRKKKTI